MILDFLRWLVADELSAYDAAVCFFVTFGVVVLIGILIFAGFLDRLMPDSWYAHKLLESNGKKLDIIIDGLERETWVKKYVQDTPSAEADDGEAVTVL